MRIMSAPISAAAAILPLLLLFHPGPAFGQDQAAEWRTEIKDLGIPMRDGRRLAADAYLPKAEGRYPAILIQTPYDRKRIGSVVGREADPADHAVRARGLYDRDHYAYVVVDWRGFHGSAEAAEGMKRIQRGRDGYDCVEWCAVQPWCDGRIGTWGGSALGKQQFDTAAEKPPHLVCCVPLIASMGQHYEHYYCGGVYREAHVKTLDRLGYGVSATALKAPRPGDPLWRMAEQVSYRPEALDVPMLMLTGWWDNYPDSVLKQFHDMISGSGPAARGGTWLIIGPWCHMDVNGAKQGDLEFQDAAGVEAKATMQFFDHWLRGLDNGWDKIAKLRYYRAFDSEDGRSGRWVECSSWPGRAGKTIRLHLHSDGTISEPPPAPSQDGGLQVRSFRYDPKSPSPTLGGANLKPLPEGPKDQSRLLGRSDVLVYRTALLETPLRVAGNIMLDISFSLDRPDGDISVRVCDAMPDGRSILVCDGIRRARYRSGSEPVPVEPGSALEMTVPVPVTAYTFAKGHRLEIILSASNWPRFERNPHTGEDHWNEASAVPLEVAVHHSAGRPTALRVPIAGDDPQEEAPPQKPDTQGKTPSAGTDFADRAASRMISMLDKDGDGKLSREELPDRMRGMFGAMDSDGDGYASAAELAAMLRKARERGRNGD